MGQIVEPYEPDQAVLFPASPRDWLPEGHLAYFISETVEQLDLSSCYAKYEQREDGRGNCAYDPRLMLKLLIYGYCTGIFSSRKLSAGVEEMEPRLFSFNSPLGACPTCDGLGTVQSFGVDLLVRDATMSLSTGELHVITDDGPLVYALVRVLARPTAAWTHVLDLQGRSKLHCFD